MTATSPPVLSPGPLPVEVGRDAPAPLPASPGAAQGPHSVPIPVVDLHPGDIVVDQWGERTVHYLDGGRVRWVGASSAFPVGAVVDVQS